MTTDRNNVKTYTLTPEEVEKMLKEQFGNKIEPVNQAKLAKQHQQRMKNRMRQQ